MSNILITGVGSYLPRKVISNNELPVNLDTNDEWIKKRTGIRQRHLVADGELTSTMAIAAAKKALQNANIDNKDIDRLVDWLKTYPRLTKGPVTLEFEEKFSKWLGRKYSVFCNSV